MDDAKRETDVEVSGTSTSEPLGDIDAPTTEESTQTVAVDESLMEEASALIDDARTYAEAEIAFQKTRAALAGRLVGVSLGLVIVALILLHIAFLALAVGLVMALEPLVTIWGAIAIVFGGLMGLVGLLGWMAMTRAQKLGGLFSTSEADGDG